MIGKIWGLIKDTFSGFMADEALSRGAAIAYFTIFSIAPLLIIVIAIAGMVFGHDAAQNAIVGQLGGLMGGQSAEALQSMIQSASNRSAGMVATMIGVGTLFLTASGAFGEIQSSLNTIWKAEPHAGLSRLVRARIAGLGLVVTLGFLMLISLVVSAGLTALDDYLKRVFPSAHLLMLAMNFVISLGLISFLFAAVYKILPDKPIAWRDVAVGAVATALLFTIGKSLIGLYIGSSNIASSYGAAGALILILVWVYYSAQIFLLGAEFTRAYAERHGSHAAEPRP
jgi:membrane protein